MATTRKSKESAPFADEGLEKIRQALANVPTSPSRAPETEEDALTSVAKLRMWRTLATTVAPRHGDAVAKALLDELKRLDALRNVDELGEAFSLALEQAEGYFALLLDWKIGCVNNVESRRL